MIKPLRVGTRGDRRYTEVMLLALISKTNKANPIEEFDKLDTKEKLGGFLWKSANILRGKIDSGDYKKYIFGLLFFKRISDVWEEEFEKIYKKYEDTEMASAEHNHRFDLPKSCLWKNVKEKPAGEMGIELNKIFNKIVNKNKTKLENVFNGIDFANSVMFPPEVLQKLINHFSKYSFKSKDIPTDLLGDAYEYLIEKFADDAGKKGGEAYTPRAVERLILKILDPEKDAEIYDPTVGSGGFLLVACEYIQEKYKTDNCKDLFLYGQEENLSTYPICKINMFLHFLDSASIQQGDTLGNPKFLKGNKLQQFDYVVSNPPYSLKEWSYDVFKSNKYGQLDGYEMPPKGKADYAFVLHMISSIKEDGKAGVVLPHGVLFRGSSEERIRQSILENDLIEAVVGLPANLFYGTSIPTVILILSKDKPKNRKNKVLFIDAKDYFKPGKNQNHLRKEDISKVVNTFNKYKDVEKYARVVDMKEMKENDYNLNISRYVDTSEEEEKIDVKKETKEFLKMGGDKEFVKIYKELYE